MEFLYILIDWLFYLILIVGGVILIINIAMSITLIAIVISNAVKKVIRSILNR